MPARNRTLNGAPVAGFLKSSLPSHFRLWENPGFRGGGGAFEPPRTPAARCLTTLPPALRTATSTSACPETVKVIVVVPNVPDPVAIESLQVCPSSETVTAYWSGESHMAQVFSMTMLSKTSARPKSTWNHCPGYWVFVRSRQPVQWSPSIALAADTSMGLFFPMLNDMPSTHADAVHDLLSSL